MRTSGSTKDGTRGREEIDRVVDHVTTSVEVNFFFDRLVTNMKQGSIHCCPFLVVNF